MNILSVETPVGEIAASLPFSVRILEQFGIDFCCGGKAALRDACAAKGLDAAAVLDEIGRNSPTESVPVAGPDWTSATLGALIDHILSTHHRYMKAELPRLDGMLEKILAKHLGALIAVGEVFRAMKEELEGHLWKEENILFPLIRHLESTESSAGQFHCGSVQNPIRVMVMEHDSAGDALTRLRGLTGGYTAPDDACGTWRAFYAGLVEMEADLHRHIHLENNILFPRAVQLESLATQTA